MSLERKSHPGIDPADFRERLQAAGLTQRRFAELVGMRRETVNRWRGGSAPAWVVPWLWMWVRIDPEGRRMIGAWSDSENEQTTGE